MGKVDLDAFLEGCQCSTAHPAAIQHAAAPPAGALLTTHLSCSAAAAASCRRASSAACTTCSLSSSSAARASAVCSWAWRSAASAAAPAAACSASCRRASACACCCCSVSSVPMRRFTAVSGPAADGGQGAGRAAGMMQAALAAAPAAPPAAAGLGQQRARATGERSALTTRGEWGCRELARRAAVGGRLQAVHGPALQGETKRTAYSNARARMGVEKEGQPGRPPTVRMRVGRRADTGEDDQWSIQKPLGRLGRAEACLGAPLCAAPACGPPHAAASAACGPHQVFPSPGQRNASWTACATGAADWYHLVTQGLLPTAVAVGGDAARHLVPCAPRRLSRAPTADMSTWWLSSRHTNVGCCWEASPRQGMGVSVAVAGEKGDLA